MTFTKASIHQMVYQVCFFLIVVLLPFHIHATSLAIFLLILNWVLEGNFKEKGQTLSRNPVALLFILFFLAHILALLPTENMKEGLFNLEKKLSFLVFPVILGSSRRIHRGQVKQICFVFAWVVLAAALFCLALAALRTVGYVDAPPLANWDNVTLKEYELQNQAVSALWDNFSYMQLSSAIGMHPTYLGVYGAFSAFVFLFGWLTNGIDSIHKSLYSFSFFLLSFFIILLSAKVVILAYFFILILGLLYYFFKIGKGLNGLFWAIVVVGGLILSVTVHPVTRFRIQQQFTHFSFTLPTDNAHWNSTSLRLAHWYCSWVKIKQNWVVGVGVGDTQDELNQCYQRIDLGPYSGGYNSHNQFLQTFLTLGIGGLILLLLCFLASLRFSSHDFFGKLFFCFTALIFISCFTESFFESQKGIVLYAFFASLFASAMLNTGPELPNSLKKGATPIA